MWTLSLLACTHALMPPGQAVVEDIRFAGRTRAVFATDSPGTLRDQMVQQASTRMVDVLGEADMGPYLGDIAFLDEGKLDTDGQRIVTWYQNHGWFDARFDGWTVEERKRKAPSGGPRVDVVGRITPGPRSRMDGALVVVDREGKARPELARLSRLADGAPFSIENWHGTLDDIRARLARGGFAYATVEGRVEAYPEEARVVAKVTVAPGIRCRFGPIRVAGEGDIPDSRILQELDFTEGDRYRPAKLAEARQKLYALGVYSIVELEPDLSDPTRAEVPLLVKLKRRPSRTLQVGPMVEVESDRQKVALQARYADADVFHRLYRWTVDAEAGAATTLDLTQSTDIGTQISDTIGPVLGLETSFTIPGLVGGKIELGNAAAVELGVEPGYREFEAEGTPSVTWTPRTWLAVTLAYRIKYHQYFDYADFAAIEADNVGASLEPRYVLSIFEEKLTVDRRNDKLAPTAGGYAGLVLGEAGGPLGGDFGFFRPTVDLRGYLPLPRLAPRYATTLAVRTGGGLILTYEPGDDVDVDERLYLGGGTSVRGWGDRRLGPALEDGDTLTPIGGNASANASVELRQRLPSSFGVSAFVDIGRVWDTVEDVAPESLSWSVGGGLRYFSPIGPIRADFGWVVDTGGVDVGDTVGAHPWSIHLGLGEAF